MSDAEMSTFLQIVARMPITPLLDYTEWPPIQPFFIHIELTMVAGELVTQTTVN